MSVIDPQEFDTYFKHGLNVLLESLHGTGKTQLIIEMADRLGLKMAYFSCSTLDPYTDLVGIPVPSEDRKQLVMVRPRAIDECDIAVFDELNRADPKVTNAVLEIINQRTINGEPLPNLKCCWAAINPVDGYDTTELDPALRDRFDIFKTLTPAPSADYMSDKEGIKPAIAKACVKWWNDHDHGKPENYISPRRLSKIAHVFQATEDRHMIRNCLPAGSAADIGKLTRWLVNANKNESLDGGDVSGLDGTADESITYEVSWIRENMNTVCDKLRDNPDGFATHTEVAKALHGGPGRKGVGAENLANEFLPVLSALSENVFYSAFREWAPSKRSIFKSSFREAIASNFSNVIPEKYKHIGHTCWPQRLPDGIRHEEV